MGGPLPEEGLSTFACLPQNLQEETIHSQVPLLDAPERKMPCVPETLVQRISRARV
jgi:hypothetical protein